MAKRTKDKLLAEILSFFTNPVFLVVLAIAVITDNYAENAADYWRYFSYASLLIVGPAIAYTSVNFYLNKNLDIDITHRESRIIPLMLSTAGAFYGLYLISQKAPEETTLIIIGRILVGMLIALTLITTVWKISLHTSTLSALATLLTSFLGLPYALTFLLIAPVGWARVKLKHHTFWQVTGGALLGLVISSVAIAIFGN